MSQVSDIWYVRFPSGRVVRAPNTLAVRQHVGSGQIPPGSRVRRTDSEEWVALDWTQEFADLVPAANARGSATRSPAHGLPLGLASRLDASGLRTVGLRGLGDELAAALDTTLSRPKLIVGAVAGGLGGGVVAGAGCIAAGANAAWWPVVWAATGALLLLIGAVADTLLTQMTYIELARLRPARWSEARAGWGKFATRLFVAWLATAEVALALIALVRWLPPGPATADGGSPGALWEVGAGVVTVLTLVIEVFLWPVLAFALLLGPVVVVEEHRPGAALGHWGRFVGRHLARVCLYEAAAVVVGLASLVFALPLGLAAWARAGLIGGFDTPLGFSLCVLAGVAGAPLIAFLAVAHVFFFLNLRYEVDSRERPRPPAARG